MDDQGRSFYNEAWWYYKSISVKVQQAVQEGHQTHFRNMFATLHPRVIQREHKVVGYSDAAVSSLLVHTVTVRDIMQQ